MVAVQEMKKSTQNASHPHHRVHNQRHAPIIGGSNNEGCGNEQQQNNSATNYDSGEDLSYGPGIVEKLRVRYLSWAQRESLVEQQRRSLETLRRATSLSTLLDREQPLDDEEEDEMVEQQSAQKTVLDQNNYNSQQHKATPVPAQRQSISNNQQLKVVGGILKSGGNNFNETIKKTATFENNSNENGNGNSEITSSGTRGSRTLKRGNDSLKRARSVEALLSERVAWNFNPSANSSFSGSVTIEDKINNARDRLVMGTDVMPPKRLTSIIDETERPPPDLVKQTLKKFEATANRRPRPSRANSKGEVASKVATFKSIINEHKPAVILPKPPNSPTKRPSHIEGVTLKPVAKPIVVAVEDVLHSPTGRRTINKNNVLSDHTPDLIPRQKHLIGKLQNNSPTMADSPVTALTKRIEKLRLSTGGNETKTESTRCATNSDMTEEKNGNHDQNEYENENVKENSVKNMENKQFVGDDEAQSTEMAAAVAATSDDIRKNDDEVLDIVAFSVDKHSQSQQNTDDDDLEETAGIVSPSNSSVFSDDEDSLGLTKRVSRKALENIAKAGTTQQFKFSNSSNTNQDLLNTSTPLSALSGNNSSAMRPLLNSAATSTVKQKSASFAAHLTSREIEKNRINELKKTTTTTTQESSPSGASSSVSSLNNVIQQQQQQKQAQASPSSTGQSELDASGSPLWASMCKRRVAPPVAVADNTTMVFNFSNRKEVPDYIDNDGVIFRRKRELPKPNESGFVMLGDLTVETSTDSDYDDFSMCPPSPCDVEFENANIVIDGKSSIRYKSKDATVRVQFNDTLTSTFEYPSEASFIVDDDVFHSPYSNTDSSSLIRNFENLALEEPDSPAHQRHHHVAVDEIIPIPTTTANYILPQINVTNVSNTNTTTTNTNTPTKNVLGNLPLDVI